MATTHGAHDLLRTAESDADAVDEPRVDDQTVETPPVAEPVETPVETPRRELTARAEIDRLRAEIEKLCRVNGDTRARDAVDSALESMARLQVVTANVDACIPPSGIENGFALIALADARLSGHADAIERGMTYTADNQMRLLQGHTQ